MDRWPILMYHQLERPPRFSRQRGLFVSPALFRRQLTELSAAGFRSGSLDNLYTSPHPRQVVLTFDDGFSRASHHALPILQDCGFTAIQFIVADRNRNQWDADHGHAAYALMDDTQIREWLAAGQEIGSHTLTHPHLTHMSIFDARREIFDSKARLEDRFQRAVRHFCYPYGDMNDAVRELVIDAGYSTACSTIPGSHCRGEDLYSLPRWMPTHRSPVLAAWLPGLAD